MITRHQLKNEGPGREQTGEDAVKIIATRHKTNKN